jgi:hypothetical protein
VQGLSLLCLSLLCFRMQLSSFRMQFSIFCFVWPTFPHASCFSFPFAFVTSGKLGRIRSEDLETGWWPFDSPNDSKIESGHFFWKPRPEHMCTAQTSTVARAWVSGSKIPNNWNVFKNLTIYIYIYVYLYIYIYIKIHPSLVNIFVKNTNFKTR